MATTLKAQIDVAAPVDEVYGQWARIESFPDYLEAVRSVRRIDDVRSRWSVSIGGQREDFYADIVDQAPGEHISWQSTDGILHFGRVEFEPIDGGTRVRLEMEWEPDGLIESFGAALGIDERQAQQDLERFKSVMESRERVEHAADERR